MASNDGHSPSSGFPNCPRGSAISLSQQQLTTIELQQSSDCSPTNSLHSTILNCTAFTDSTRSNDIAVEQIHTKTLVSMMLVACRPLPSNSSSSVPYLWSCYVAMAVVTFVSSSLPSNGSMWHVAPSLRLFVLNSLQVYHHFFFSEGCACDICNWSPLPWFLCDCSPAAPSSRLPVLSGSLIRREPVQVYHNHHHIRSVRAKVPRVLSVPTSLAL
jgi:hypothetical protein